MGVENKYRDIIVEYIANPDHEFPNRGKLAKLCRISEQGLRKHFKPADFDDMEAEGLRLRRRRCASISAKVDSGLIKRAQEGEPAACKLYYQRIEGWSEKQIRESSGPDGGPIKFQDEAASALLRAILDSGTIKRALPRQTQLVNQTDNPAEVICARLRGH